VTSPDAFAAARRSIAVGTVLALIAALLYGANVPAARLASQAGMPGADLIGWRAILFLPVIALAAWFTGERLRLLPQERGPTLRLAVAASLTATFYLSSVDRLPVPMAVVLFYMFPLFVIVLASRVEGRRISRLQMAVFGIAFTGLLIAVGPSLHGLSAVGVAFALGAALACATMFIIAGRVSNAPLRNSFWSQAVMGPFAFSFAFLQGGPVSLSVFWLAPLAISVAMCAYAIAYILQLKAARKISADRAGLLFLFEPVMAIFAAGFILKETLSALQMAGVALILVALAAEIVLGAKAGAEPPPQSN
jgi:drug/metabolite transporter (DMT)-like permease